MFKDIKGYEGKYKIDQDGNIFSAGRMKGAVFCYPRMLKYDFTSTGYLRVTLCKDNKTKRFLIHRLVYEHFNGEIPTGMEINHKDENKLNNNFLNLEVMTSKENNHYSREKLGYKLYREDVEFIRSSGMTTREAADTYGISLRHALRIIKCERWDLNKR